MFIWIRTFWNPSTVFSQWTSYVAFWRAHIHKRILAREGENTLACHPHYNTSANMVAGTSWCSVKEQVAEHRQTESTQRPSSYCPIPEPREALPIGHLALIFHLYSLWWVQSHKAKGATILWSPQLLTECHLLLFPSTHRGFGSGSCILR